MSGEKYRRRSIKEGTTKLNYEDRCPDCGSRAYLDMWRSERVCEGCGLVLSDDMVFPGMENINEENQRELSERILPQLFFGPRDAFGKPVSWSKQKNLYNTAKTYNLKSNERSAINMESRIRRLASQLGLASSVAPRAVYLFYQARKNHVVKKPCLNDWALALLLTACREIRYIITIEDLIIGSPEELKQRSKTNVRRYHNLIKSALQLQISSPGVNSYITYFAGKLGIINQTTIQQAIEVAASHIFANPNSTPHCVAAGALYIVSEKKHGLSQKSFCNQTNLSEISLRHWMNRLGGYVKPSFTVPDVNLADLGPEYQYKHTAGKQDRKNTANNPPAPDQSIAKDGNTYQYHAQTDSRDALKKLGNRNKIVLNPRRTLNRAKNVAHSRNKKANAKHPPVNHSTPPFPRRQGRARRKAR